MSRVVTLTDTLSVNPSSYDNTDASYYAFQTAANSYTDENSTTYSTITLKRGASAVTYVYFLFDTSSIPANATIDSISCKAKIFVSNGSSSNVATKQCQMFSGTTAKGSAASATTTPRVVTLSVGTWTRQELSDARVRMYAVRGSSNTSSGYSLRFYGATLTVSYTYDATYYAVSGSSDISGVTITTAEVDYIEGSDVVVTISGASGLNLSVIDNGADVSGDIVASGSDYIYTINGIAADHVITVSESQQQGQTLFVKQSGAWVSVDAIYVKSNGAWCPVDTLSVKQNGAWIN